MPSEHFLSRKEAIIRYSHSPVAMSIGEKRNRMTEIAAGDFIVHFDDDDFYAANYVEHMVAGIRQGYDMVKLSGWFLYSGVYRTLGYWDCHRTKGPHYVWSKEPQVFKMVDDREAEEFKHYYLGYGFSYAYRKQVWESGRFPEVDWNEDGPFAIRANEQFKLGCFQDTSGLCLHVLHKQNMSRCFPQYVLPEFLVDRLFGQSCYPVVQASWD